RHTASLDDRQLGGAGSVKSGLPWGYGITNYGNSSALNFRPSNSRGGLGRLGREKPYGEGALGSRLVLSSPSQRRILQRKRRRFLVIKLRINPLQIRDLRQVVDDDVERIGVMDEIVLMLGLRWI